MTRQSVITLTAILGFVACLTGASGNRNSDQVFEEWRQILAVIYQKDATQEFHSCNATEEETLSRVYLERLFRDHGGSGIMIHAWPRLDFYENRFKNINLHIATTKTQCRFKAYYHDHYETLVCHNQTCVQCMNINPLVSTLLNEACHDLKLPVERTPNENVHNTSKKKQEAPVCGWLDYKNSTKQLDNLKMTKWRVEIGKYVFLEKCDAPAELVVGIGYLKQLKTQHGSIDEKYRRFYEDKLRFLVQGTEMAAQKTFCNPTFAIQMERPKPAEIRPDGWPGRQVSKFGKQICGPDGVCIECTDIREEETSLLYEACNLQTPKEQSGCESPTTPTSKSIGTSYVKDFIIVGFSGALNLMT